MCSASASPTASWTRAGDTEVEIAAMASDLDERAAVLIFPPEGGNFSERRGRGASSGSSGAATPRTPSGRARLGTCRRRGREERSRRSRRPPDADVIFAGHVGFPTSLGEAWRLLPVDQTVEIRLWAVPAEEIPAGRDARIDWLFGRWCALDAWVGHRQESAIPSRRDGAPRSPS